MAFPDKAMGVLCNCLLGPYYKYYVMRGWFLQFWRFRGRFFLHRFGGVLAPPFLGTKPLERGIFLAVVKKRVANHAEWYTMLMMVMVVVMVMMTMMIMVMIMMMIMMMIVMMAYSHSLISPKSSP